MIEDESPVDAEDWDIVFQAYEEYPILAFILAQHLDSIKPLFGKARKQGSKPLRG